MKNLGEKCFLIAGMGTSPAVLTETVWARVCRVRFRGFERVGNRRENNDGE